MFKLKSAVLMALIMVMALLPTPKVNGQQNLPKVKVTTPTGIVVHSTHLVKGDTLFSYYVENENQYITGKIGLTDRMSMMGYIFTSFNNAGEQDFGITETDGNPIGEPILFGVKRNNQLYKVEFTGITLFDNPVQKILSGNLSLYYVENANIVGMLDGELKPVPWWDAYNRLCPVEGVKEIDAGEAIIGMGVVIHQFKPTLCKSFTKQIIKGNGSFYKYNTSTDMYRFGDGDPQFGEVIIRYTVIPFDGCNEDALIYDCTIKFKKKVDIVINPFNKWKFYKAVKSHLKIEKVDGEVKVYYDAAQLNDFNFPKLTFILYSSPPLREITRVESTDVHPSVVLGTNGRGVSYVKVIATEYGSFQNLWIR